MPTDLSPAHDVDLKAIHWGAVEDYDRAERAAGRPVSAVAANLAGLRAVYDHGVAAGLRIAVAPRTGTEDGQREFDRAMDRLCPDDAEEKHRG